MSRLELRPATLADIDLLRRWEAEPHIVEAGIADWDWEDDLARTPPWREQLIAELDGQPIGFLEIIVPALDDSHYWGDCPPNLRALDIWIGEPSALAKGHGTDMIRLAIARCFADPEVEAIIIDPLANNLRARRFYERQGFVYVEDRWFGDDHCAIYRLPRDRWLKQP